MHRAIDVRGELIGDELGGLGVFVPGLRHAQVALELGLIGSAQLAVLEYVTPIVEGELVAVVEEAPALPLVGGQGFVERMIVLEVGRVHVFGDEPVNRGDHAAIGERGDPGRLDVEDVVGAGLRDVLGDRLGVLVRVGEFGDVVAYPGELLPERAGEVARLKRLQPGFVCHRQGRHFKRLRRLHRAIGRAVLRLLRRGLDRQRLHTAERRGRVGQIDRGLRHVRQREAAERRRPRGQQQSSQDLASRSVAPQPGVQLMAQCRIVTPIVALAHVSPLFADRFSGRCGFGRPVTPA